MTTKHMQELTDEEKKLLNNALEDVWYSTVKYADPEMEKIYDSLVNKLKGIL